MKGALAGTLMLAVVVGPVVALVGFSGGTDEPTPVAAQLDLSQIPAAYQPWVTKAARTCPAVAGALLPAQIDQESSWDPTRSSPVGATGLAQFMPGTWRTWGIDADGGGADIHDAADAIMSMARYDCWLAKKAKTLIDAHQATGDVVSLMLAGYNAGPDAVQHFHGIPPYPETQQYVSIVLAKEADYALSPGAGTGSSEFGNIVATTAMHEKGTPYSWGAGTANGPSLGFAQGAGTRGYDCSGLVLYAVARASGGKILLPHSSERQATMGQHIDRAHIQPGDVIAFQLGAPGDYDHIGIYVGNGLFVHAPKTGDVVKTSRMSDSYYKSRTITIRRFG